MLLDRCIISTEFEVMPEVVTDRVAFNQNHGTDILDNDPRTRQVSGPCFEVQRSNLTFFMCANKWLINPY